MQYSRRASLTILAGFFLSLVVLSPIVSFASNPSYSVTVSYTVSTTHSGVTTMMATVSASGKQLSNPLTLTLVGYFNGSSTAFTSQSCQDSTYGASSASCTFNVPWQGGGYYKLVGSVNDSKGELVFQTTIDPLAEPAWRH